MRALYIALSGIFLTACKGFDTPLPKDQALHLALAVPDQPAPFPMILGRGNLDGVLSLAAYGTETPPEKPWQWASVTKQLVAVLVMQSVERGELALDDTIGQHLPDFGTGARAAVTIEQLLRNTSGLGEPEDLPANSDVELLQDYCDLPMRGEPGVSFSYSNCDFMVVGAILEKVTGMSWDALLQARISQTAGMQQVGEVTSAQLDGRVVVSGRPQVYGASAGLFGLPADLLRFDAALMRGDLLSKSSLETMWEGDPSKGFVALGQWSFQAPLAGCKNPVRLVERRGHIGLVQVRNVIAPDFGLSLVAFTNDANAEFGEVWMGKGVTFDLVSWAFCQAS